MIYLVIGAIFLIILLAVRLKLIIIKNDEIDATLVIGRIIKIKIDIDQMIRDSIRFTSYEQTIRDGILTFKKINKTKKFIYQIVQKIVIEEIIVEEFLKEESLENNLAFFTIMTNLQFQSITRNYFKKCLRERYDLTLNADHTKLKFKLSLKSTVWSLGTTILLNYHDFKTLIRKRKENE